MKRFSVDRVYAGALLLIFGGIVLHAPLSVGFGVLFPQYELLIKSWKEILMVLLVPLAIILVNRRQLWGELSRDWLVWLLGVYAALHIVMSVVLYQGLAATAAGLAIDLRYVLFFGLVYVLIKTYPEYRLRLLITGAIGAMVVVGFGVLQLFLPADILSHIGYSTQTIAPYLTVDKNPDYIRINSTLRGPNPLGAYAVIVLTMMASLLVRVRYRLKTPARRWGFAAVAIAGVAVLWVSYSRSALVAAIVAIGIIGVIVMKRRASARTWVGLSIILCLIGAGLAIGRQSSFVTNVILHDNPSTGAATNSNQGHLSSVQTGLVNAAYQPFGAGVGSTGSASLHGNAPTIIENQYLFITHETGWLGLLLFAGLYVLIMMRLWRRRQDWVALGAFASGVGLAIVGLLLPVWVDDTVSIIWWGLAAIALGTGVKYEQRTSK